MLLMVYNYNLNMIIVNYWVKSISILLLMMLSSFTKADDVQKKWLLMKETWLKDSKQVCGMTKGTPRHKETW